MSASARVEVWIEVGVHTRLFYLKIASANEDVTEAQHAIYSMR